MSTLNSWNLLAGRVKKFITGGLTCRFNLPVYTDDTTCRIIAAATTKDMGNEVWLNGEKVKLNEIAIQVVMVSRQNNITD